MKDYFQIELTQGKVTLVSREDFDEISKYQWYAKPQYKRVLYAYRQSVYIDGKQRSVSMARQIMGFPDGMQVDHINGDTLDNRRCNLRLATPAQNGRNRGKYPNNTSGFKGAFYHYGRWQAGIRVDGKLMYLGTYNTPEEAHAAYCEAAKKYHGEFWRAA